MQKIIGFWLLVFVLVSCKKETEMFEYKGAVTNYNAVEKVVVDAVTTQSYYVYTPSYYDATKTYPVIFCFSPTADGKTPVDSLRYAAEAFGYIVAGSNDVRNNFEGNSFAVKNLVYDVESKFSVDGARKYACGFSGGGRLATILAEQGLFTGVISCSAAAGNARFLTPYPWYGIGGKADFNYSEMMGFEPSGTMKNNYALAFHTKGHQWPDSSYLYDAVAFLELRAMDDGLRQPNKAIINAFKTYVVNAITDLEFEKRYVDAILCGENAINMLGTITQTTDIDFSLQQLKSSTGYKVEMVRMKELKDLDKKLTETYAAAFVKMDTKWWTNELQKLDERIVTATGETKYALMRVKGSLGIIGFMYSKRFVEMKRPEAQNVLEVYELLEPQNPDVFYYKALHALNRHKKAEAQKWLNKSVKLGLADKQNRLKVFEGKLNIENL